MTTESPDIFTGAALRSADGVWNLFERSGFFSEAKRQIQAPQSTLEANLVRLMAAPDLCRAVFLGSPDDPVGHYSLARTHQCTWEAQHLAVAPAEGPPLAALTLLRELTEVVRISPEIEWVRSYHRPANPWPEYVLGRFARSLPADGVSQLREVGLLTPPGDMPEPNAAWPQVRIAGPGDIGAIRELLEAEGWLVDPEDLIAPELELAGMAALARAHGLERRRSVLIAETDGRVSGAALMDFASPGWNLSRLADASHLVVPGSDPATLSALTASVVELRAGDEVPPVVIASLPSSAVLESRGALRHKTYSVWTAHRSVLDDFRAYLGRRCRLEEK